MELCPSSLCGDLFDRVACHAADGLVDDLEHLVKTFDLDLTFAEIRFDAGGCVRAPFRERPYILLFREADVFQGV